MDKVSKVLDYKFGVMVRKFKVTEDILFKSVAQVRGEYGVKLWKVVVNTPYTFENGTDTFIGKTVMSLLLAMDAMVDPVTHQEPAQAPAPAPLVEAVEEVKADLVPDPIGELDTILAQAANELEAPTVPAPRTRKARQ